ncbi:putative ribonuclease H-like domain-containing protein [Tanacetum coccineum]|uniref:Ribonuclease H-like domain-containing protein n=1 Tax=Tanacetum coccineum TaxID=301880 RepID=A0ABQ5EQ05_9ASTR
MDDFCREKGIKREYSVARTPQQNGVAERKNRTLIEAARTMLEKSSNDFAEESHDGSSLKENGTADQQVNTARPDINTGSREVSTALPEVRYLLLPKTWSSVSDKKDETSAPKKGFLVHI